MQLSIGKKLRKSGIEKLFILIKEILNMFHIYYEPRYSSNVQSFERLRKNLVLESSRCTVSKHEDCYGIFNKLVKALSALKLICPHLTFFHQSIEIKGAAGECRIKKRRGGREETFLSLILLRRSFSIPPQRHYYLPRFYGSIN